MTLNQSLPRSLFAILVFSALFVLSCEENGEDPDLPPVETGNSTEYNLFSTSTGQIIGSIEIFELEDNTSRVLITMNNVDPAASHPTHIHNNSGAEGGGIAISLQNVDGSTNISETFVAVLDDGTPITYDELINFDGHVNVHQSESDLATLVAQGDIGPNEFTINVEDYDILPVGGSGVEGDITFVERVSGEILAVLSLENTPSDGVHPAHVHLNSVATGGGIVISLNPVDGNSGMSATDFSALDDGTAITFSELIDFNGHVKVHLSESDLATVVAAGDIGENELTGDMESYALNEVAVTGINGTAIFYERRNGTTLVEIMLENTPADGDHPAHIHANSAVEGGGVVFPLNNVDGNTGMSMTDISMDGESNPVTYEELTLYDGHINVHLSVEEISTIVARGDIGGNALTGETTQYSLIELNNSGVSGTITLEERVNGFTLATIMLDGTPTDGDHPAHIHSGSLEEPGGIVVPLSNVDGNSGMSVTHIEMNNSDEAVTYADLLEYNGHVKVHLSPEDLATVVSGGNIGSNGNSSARVSFADDVKPIIDANCQVSGCHGSNGSIPSWDSYATISANAQNIKTRTGNQSMPPASSGNSLTTDQIQLIADWVDQGAENN